MRPRKPNTKSINEGQAQPPGVFPFFDAPLHITPGELAAISIGLRVLKGTGAPGDYFGEAIDLSKDAARFIRKLEPEQINPQDVLFFKESPNGQIEWAHVGDDVTATELTLTGLLKQVMDSDNKNKKPRTFLGSIRSEPLGRSWPSLSKNARKQENFQKGCGHHSQPMEQY